MTTRKDLFRFGPKRRSVRGFVETGGELIRVQWRHAGALRTKSWPNTTKGKAEARAWAEAFATNRDREPETVQLTQRAMWELYAVAEFPHLRPKTQRNYTDRWKDWETFSGRDRFPEQVTAEMLDSYRRARTKLGRAVKQTGEHVKLVRQVYAWAEQRELIARNRIATYRFKIAKEERVAEPAEYAPADFPALLTTLDPRNPRQWRAWVLMSVLGNQGMRQNAALHVQWADVDFETMTLMWQAQWDKMGVEHEQMMTPEAADAFRVALGYALRDKYRGPWVFYSSHRDKTGDPVYTAQAFYNMLKKAEKKAGIRHERRRAAHGFRRMVAGNANDITKDVVAAMHFIGDSDLRQARKYVKPRDERQVAIAERMPKGFAPTVTQPQPTAEMTTAPQEGSAGSAADSRTYDAD